jgi:ribonuclease P protein component
MSVSKRNFKKAVDRNLIKRRMREGYRLHKAILPQQPTLKIALIYTSKDIMSSDRIHQSIVKILSRLAIS